MAPGKGYACSADASSLRATILFWIRFALVFMLILLDLCFLARILFVFFPLQATFYTFSQVWFMK